MLSFTNSASDVFTQVVKDLKGDYEGDIHLDLYKLYKNNYNKTLDILKGDEYAQLRHKLELNQVKIASYKAHHVTKALKGMKGDNYDEKAKLMLKRFNTYQVTEYNTMTARTRTAKQFDTFKKEAELFPNLVWIRSRSSVLRDEHERLVGTTLPVNHPFWQENQPGNLWNCKCDFQQTNNATSTKVPDTVSPATGLEGDPSVTGQLITDAHPYVDKQKKHLSVVRKFIKKNYLDGFINDFRKSLPENGLIVKNKAIITGEMKITSNSVEDCYKHTGYVETQQEIAFLKDNIKNYEYLGWGDVTAGKHLDADFFLYYKTKIADKTFYLNMKYSNVHFSEVPYSYSNVIDLKKLKKGLPDGFKKKKG